MVWQYITSPTLIKSKKGLLLTVIRIQGTAEARRCGAVAVRSQVITWNPTLTLYALYLPLPPPLPAPPPVSQAAVLIASLVTLTRGTQGCPKIISFVKSNWHPAFKKSLQSSFSLPLYTRTFLQHPLPKNTLPSSSVIDPRILFRSFFRYSFLPFLDECQLFMPKEFWNLPANPVWRVPGFMKEGKADSA